MAKGIMLHEVGEQVDLYLLIKSSTKGIASNGKPFLTENDAGIQQVAVKGRI